MGVFYILQKKSYPFPQQHNEVEQKHLAQSLLVFVVTFVLAIPVCSLKPSFSMWLNCVHECKLYVDLDAAEGDKQLLGKPCFPV